MSKILQVSYHRCNKAIKIAYKSVESFSVRENWTLYELVMAKNKIVRLHNKGFYHKGQYNVTFFCTKWLSIQTNKRMATSASLCEGPIFYFYVFTFMQESKFSPYSFFLFWQAKIGGKHQMLKDLWQYDFYVNMNKHKPLRCLPCPTSTILAYNILMGPHNHKRFLG